jgi:hypothetical protein
VTMDEPECDLHSSRVTINLSHFVRSAIDEKIKIRDCRKSLNEWIARHACNSLLSFEGGAR